MMKKVYKSTKSKMREWLVNYGDLENIKQINQIIKTIKLPGTNR